MVGEKRGSAEIAERLELGRVRAKICNLEPVSPSKGIIRREETQSVMVHTYTGIDLNANVGDSSNKVCHEIHKDEQLRCEVDYVKLRGLGLDLNAEDVSSSINNYQYYPYKNNEKLNSIDDLECISSIGPSKEKDPMRVWKKMKQNGFLSSSHGVVPTPKPRGRKSRSDGLKKKLELAKKEQIDRFAKVAAPSGLLNGLNPGIINHVRNSKQVHSIIEALVRSKKLENHHSDSKHSARSKSGTKEKTGEDEMEFLNGLGMHTDKVNHSYENASTDTLSRNKHGNMSPIIVDKGQSSNSEQRGADSASNIIVRRMFGQFSCISPFTVSESKRPALKLSSTTEVASENISSLSLENSEYLSNVSSLSVKAANVSLQWLELLQQDIKGRLGALDRSRKRVQAVIQTELPLLMSKELFSNQENVPHGTRSSNVAANVHLVRWSSLFKQMLRSLCEEEKQLETWQEQVKEMQFHCEHGLLPGNTTVRFQQLGVSEDGNSVEKTDVSLEKDFAVRAAAASIYSTCNFLMSMQNLPCS